MDSALYVTLSSQMALEKRLNTLADNVANASTVGFRASEIKFDQLLAGPQGEKVAFVTPGEDYLSTASGGLKQTGNQLDFAVKGDAWFAINTPAGQVLTRDGRFSMTPNGDLVTLKGYQVLDPGGAPIQLDPNAGPPTASRDGSLRQNGNRVGTIGTFSADLSAGYTRYENSGVIPVNNPQPVVDRADVGVVQGYVEESNVNAVAEMTRLIMVSRTFEAANSTARDTNNTFNEAVKVLGGS